MQLQRTEAGNGQQVQQQLYMCMRISAVAVSACPSALPGAKASHLAAAPTYKPFDLCHAMMCCTVVQGDFLNDMLRQHTVLTTSQILMCCVMLCCPAG
jgi:hypothetical protein